MNNRALLTRQLRKVVSNLVRCSVMSNMQREDWLSVKLSPGGMFSFQKMSKHWVLRNVQEFLEYFRKDKYTGILSRDSVNPRELLAEGGLTPHNAPARWHFLGEFVADVNWVWEGGKISQLLQLHFGFYLIALINWSQYITNYNWDSKLSNR